ncbi:alpha-hydroxy acid oxidase [Psychrobacter sp. FDAARGOS_221]|uniref:alpha-hydroxy acid oxidase n=1 Tax=Psychrobacter sp. FDAARGOS_221 TaxID=1975705 RepID=UPI000BB55093|nr:alpha-hydroxy acid oxidase [Psychrobacter sp. FDAARGOS_221]PNK59832.1 alpha-hydroxy-acid oxidizing enzyme [Psychrobacter sp. FDAARGOS_221]
MSAQFQSNKRQYPNKQPHSQSYKHQQRWQPLWSHIPNELVTLADYEHAVRQHLPEQMQALLFENNLIGDSNKDALDGYQWLPRVLNPKPVDTSCRLYNPYSAVPLDIQLSHPLWLSPVAHQGLYHPQAELATMQAAQVMNTPVILSSFGNTAFDQLLPQANVGVVQWYWQALPAAQAQNISNPSSKASTQARREYNLQLIDTLIESGMQLLVLTVDAPHTGVRAVSRRFGAQLPEYCQAVNMPSISQNHSQANSSESSLAQLLAQAPNWEDIAWLVARCRVPVMLKGILHPQDAQLAKDSGCAGIIASNHGRRVLADIMPVATCLPKLREQVGDDMVIIADGGVSSGSDMAKMIAIGADAVGIGRGYIYGLALAGALGVAHVNKLLLEELEVTMAILGVGNITELRQATLIQS